LINHAAGKTELCLYSVHGKYYKNVVIRSSDQKATNVGKKVL